MSVELGELAVRFGCELRGDPELRVTRVATLAGAVSGDLGFLANPHYRPQLAATRATVVVTDAANAALSPVAVLVCANPYATYARIAALLLANTSICYSQVDYVPGQPSIDCTKVHNTVAVILCGVPEAAQADWDLNSAWRARYFTVNDTQRRMLDTDQQTWRQSLDRICALPRYPTPEDQAGKAMLDAFGRMLLGRVRNPQRGHT